MASVFLSYARSDAARAKCLAEALVEAGHEVWWDRHIHGGSEFSDEIQAALDKAQVVLVMWSRTSIASEWVRDEAAEGRDSGRLLPVLVDNIKAPLGFRQRQTIDMSRWSGRGQPPNLDSLLAAIAAKSQAGPTGPPGPEAHSPSTIRKLLPTLAAGLIAVLLLLGAWIYSQEKIGGTKSVATLAILPFEDLSPAGDKAYFAEGVAEAILGTLAAEPNIRVIGRSSSRQLHAASADISAIRKQLGVTHVLEGSARTEGEALRLSVRLVNARDGSQVWTERYDRQMSSVFAIQDEIGRSVAQRLRGTLGRGQQRAATQVTGVNAYTLYLAATAKMRDRDEQSLREAVELARQVIALDPNYAPGHAIYAQLISLLSNNPYYWPRNPAYFFSGEDPQKNANRLARAHAMRAVKLAPNSAEGHAALGLFADRPQQTVASLSRAISLDPSRTDLRLSLANAYGKLGRTGDAGAQIRTAVEVDPLWHVAVRRLAVLHASAGRHSAAEAAVSDFQRRGGDQAIVANIRAQLARMRGDLAAAAELGRLANRLKPDPETVTTLLILYQPHWLNLPDQARKLEVVEGSEMFPRLTKTGQNRRELQQVRAEGAQIWAKPWEEVYIFALAAARDWPHLEKLYDARPDKVHGVCEYAKSMTVPVSMIIALHMRERRDEAGRLHRCMSARLKREGAGPWSAAWTPGYLAFAQAQLLALSGDRPGALRALDRAIESDWRGLSSSSKLSDYPALDPLRSTPEYARSQSRLSQILAAQRQRLQSAGG